MSEVKISPEIQELFEVNKINDLRRFMKNRETINCCNMALRYSYFATHYSGILVSTIAVEYVDANYKSMLWLGIGLNVLATFISAIEEFNNKLSKKMLHNIENIKKNNYIDESDIIESTRNKSSNDLFSKI
jgi:hypothetical protein